MNHQINIDEAIAIAKEYHLETEVTECIKQGMSPIEALIENDIYYLYVQNRIMAIEIQHTVENDPITGDLYDEWYQIDITLICDYCIIPEADYILKEDTSFLNESISADVKC